MTISSRGDSESKKSIPPRDDVVANEGEIKTHVSEYAWSRSSRNLQVQIRFFTLRIRSPADGARSGFFASLNYIKNRQDDKTF